MVNLETFEKGKKAAIAGKLSVSRDLLEPIAALNPGHPSLYYLALAELKVGDINEATNHIDSFIKNNPKHFGAHILASRILLKKGKLEEAKDILNKGISLNSSTNPTAEMLREEIAKLEAEKKALSYINIIDTAFNKNPEEARISHEVIAAAQSLSEIIPKGNWAREIIQAKIANFHFAPSIEHALANYIPHLLEISVEFDYISWPKRIHKYIQGKKIIDIGCGFGGYGTGFLCAGAESYLGLDPVMSLESTRAKNKRIREWADMGISPNEIVARCPDIRLFQGTSEELHFDEKFDVISLHNVTEHLMHLDIVFEGLTHLCHADTKIIFMHHNYYCWNGHHKSPNQPKHILGVNGEGEQLKLMDWKHINFADQAPDDHYVKTHLNRVTLKEIKEITQKYFKVEEWNEIPSNQETLDRLNPDIITAVKSSHPHLTKRDLEVNVVFAICEAKR